MASEFEYRHRFAIIALVFIFAYAFYNLDHLNIVYAIVPRNLGVLDRNVLARFVYGVSALLASIGAAILTWASAYRLSSPRGDQPQTVALLVGGPYRYVRNPHYIGYFLLVVALGSFQSPRLLPSMRPQIAADGELPHWRQAFGAQAFQWGFVATLVAFACTLSDPIGYMFACATLLFLALQKLVRSLLILSRST